MRLLLDKLPASTVVAPAVGNVYRTKGGRTAGKPDGTQYLVVVAIRAKQVHCLGLDRDGRICAVSSCYIGVMENRWPIGFCEEWHDLCFDVHVRSDGEEL